jgi:hypothetical protein
VSCSLQVTRRATAPGPTRRAALTNGAAGCHLIKGVVWCSMLVTRLWNYVVGLFDPLPSSSGPRSYDFEAAGWERVTPHALVRARH